MKKIIILVLMLLLLASCGSDKEEENTVGDVPISTGIIVGPTGIGAMMLMDKAKEEYTNYSFTLAPNANDVVSRLTNGEFDIGALPTNLAATIYNKTNGQYRVIALNCSGVLYILGNDDSIKTIKGLKGKTIYAYGQGANPEYILDFVLTRNGLDPESDVTIEFMSEASEIVNKMNSDESAICMLPIPAATALLTKNENIHKMFDVTEEFNKISLNGKLVMGCLVANKDFIEAHPEEVELYLDRYEQSVNEALENSDEVSKLMVENGIAGSEELAKKAIPDAGIICVTGDNVKTMLEGYLNILYEANPKSIGGKMPGEDFYYNGK